MSPWRGARLDVVLARLVPGSPCPMNLSGSCRNSWLMGPSEGTVLTAKVPSVTPAGCILDSKFGEHVLLIERGRCLTMSMAGKRSEACYVASVGYSFKTDVKQTRSHATQRSTVVGETGVDSLNSRTASIFMAPARCRDFRQQGRGVYECSCLRKHMTVVHGKHQDMWQHYLPFHGVDLIKACLKYAWGAQVGRGCSLAEYILVAGG